MTTTTADGLEEDTVGAVSFGDEGAISKDVDSASATTGSAGTTHCHRGGDVATSSAGVDRTCCTTTTANGLEEECMSTITTSLNGEISDLRRAAKGDRGGAATISTSFGETT